MPTSAAPDGQPEPLVHGSFGRVIVERKPSSCRRWQIVRFVIQRVNIIARVREALLRKKTKKARAITHPSNFVEGCRSWRRPFRKSVVASAIETARYFGVSDAFQFPDARRAERSASLHQSGEIPRDRFAVIDRGKGVRVYDETGKDYIEAMAGLWCTALGWGETILADVAAEQMKKLAFGHLFGGKSHEPAIALAEKLKEVIPFPTGKVFSPTPDRKPTIPRSSSRGMPPTRAATPKRRRFSRATAPITASRSRVRRSPAAGQSSQLRPAAGFRDPRRLPAFLPQRRSGRERGTVHAAHGRKPRRADPEGRRRHNRAMIAEPIMARRGDHAAERLFPAIVQVLANTASR